MPKSELAEDVKSEAITATPVDLFIGITGSVDAGELHQRLQAALSNPSLGVDASRIVVAYPRAGNDAAESVKDDSLALRLQPYALPAADPTNLPWVVTSAAQRTICALAVETEAKACVLLHGDLALLRTDILQAFVAPILEKDYDLVLPVYPSGKFEGLLNHSILAPLTRSLYGKRVRYPLPQDMSCSAHMLTRIVEAQNANPLLWPAVLATLGEYQMCQMHINMAHVARTEGVELSTVLSSLVGSAYSEMESYAAQWQSVRGSRVIATSVGVAQQMEDGEPIDAKPLVDSFLLGSHNLQEVWGLVLPPVTLLELKKLSRLSPEAFRMPDELWVRIIYDFALAHRLRKISRVHLLGAMTPLYLGWVASYVQEVAKATPFAAEQRLEQLAKAYEDGKPYLLSRWRWPDRFNP